MTMRVGHTLVYDKRIKKEPHMRPASYRDVRKDRNGWVNIRDGLPDDFDLVYMRLLGNKTIPGWLAGNTWYGIRLKKGERILAWNRGKAEQDEKPI